MNPPLFDACANMKKLPSDENWWCTAQTEAAQDAWRIEGMQAGDGPLPRTTLKSGTLWYSVTQKCFIGGALPCQHGNLQMLLVTNRQLINSAVVVQIIADRMSEMPP